MKRNKALPGSRLFVYLAGLAGAFRTAERSWDEAGASTDQIDPTTRAEQRDLNSKAVWIAGIGLLLGLWAIVVVLYPFFNYLSHERAGGLDPAKVLAYLPPEPPEPRNEHSPSSRIQEFRAAEAAALASYRWVDRSKSVVSIPISRAIQLTAERGIPPSKPGGAGYHPPEQASMQTGFEDKVEPLPR